MASLTFAVDEQLKSDIEYFCWVNWSEVNREELNRKRISEEFLETGTLSKQDQEFCEKTDWHPVDELPLKESFIKELEEARKEPAGKPMTLNELDTLLGLK